jgi:S1-C subfamily serine protease
MMLLCLALAGGAQDKSLASRIESARLAVVQIIVQTSFMGRLAVPNNAAPAVQSIADCVNENAGTCIVGTGFFVNREGDAVTASHVASDVHEILQFLAAHNVKASPLLGVSIPNIEAKNVTLGSSTQLFPITIAASDSEHDVAVFRATVNPFTNMEPGFMAETFRADAPPTVVSTPSTPKILRLSTIRPRDGDRIFACGFPFDQPGMVTTSGQIASAWKSEVPLSSVQQLPIPIDVYWADLRINPGNSGGPVMRVPDSAVIGMIVESRGSLGVVVPASYITKFLDAHRIKWSPPKSH